MSSSNLSPLKQAFLKIEELEARLAEGESRQHEPIAIVGIGCRFPGGADGPDAYWRMLRDGVDATREVPADRWDVDRFYDDDPDAPGKTYSRRGGFLDRSTGSTREFFGISPREAASMDPQQRLLLEVAWEAFEDAGMRRRALWNQRTGVFVGVSNNDYGHAAVPRTPICADRRLSSARATPTASRPAGFRTSLGLQGPIIAIDTACSSSLVAVHLAVPEPARAASATWRWRAAST